MQLVAVDDQHLIDRPCDATHDVGDLVRLDALAHDDELVAGESRDGVDVSDHPPHPLGHLHEDAIAGLMAERVVDRLEPVEVDEEHRYRIGAASQPSAGLP